MTLVEVPQRMQGGDRTMSEGQRPVRMATRKLDFFYDRFQALHSVDIDIASHRITSLIGPSGCGKSTFLRCLNRMNDEIQGAHLNGRVLLDDYDIYAAGASAEDLSKRVGMVFQRPNPFPMSILDNIAYGPRIHGEGDRNRLAEIVERSLHQAALWDE